MCATSTVLDYGCQRVPLTYWTWPTWWDFQMILRRLDDLDRKLSQPECHDSRKGDWMQQVEQRLRRLEGEPPAGYQSFVTGATSPVLGE